MTQEQIKAFLFEIGEVCARHHIGGVAGIWFGGKDSEMQGRMYYHDPTDSDMKRMVEALAGMLERWRGELYTPDQGVTHHIKGVVYGDKRLN